MNEYAFEISLRVTHPVMPPDVICSLLAMETEIKRKAGDARHTPKGNPLPGIWKETYCGFDVPRREGDSIPECLRTMLKNLNSQKSGINEIRATGGSLEFYILASPKESTLGEKLPWEILAGLADLGIDLSLEVHTP